MRLPKARVSKESNFDKTFIMSLLVVTVGILIIGAAFIVGS